MIPLLLAGALLVAPAAPVLPPSQPSAVWPVRPVAMVSGFDPPAVAWGAGHRGIDLATYPGQQVVAATAGQVTFAADLAGRGVVVVDHGAVRTTYEPVLAGVAVGDWVGVGEAIGVIATGTGHCGAGTCLHWGLLRGDDYLDPRLLLGLRPVLKPHTGA